MGIDVRVVTESEDEVAVLLDPQNCTKELLPDLSDSSIYCLKFIDPYGDTVFNQFQIPILVSEVEKMLLNETRSQVRLHWEKILELANQARKQAHLYLKFYGD